jgi:hypothetical protein
MATSPKAFLIELYREYLEDASFLYDQRRALLADPEISWRDLDSFDERLEACLDGLVVGGDLGIDVCKDRLENGDAGEVYAAIRVLCRQGRKETVLETRNKLTPDEPERLIAIADALKQDCPEAWLDDLAELDFAGERGDAQLMLFARIVGHRRWKRAAAKLAGALPNAGPEAIPEILWAMGRTGSAETRRVLTAHLKDANERVRQSAADALLSLHDSSVGSLLSAAKEPWAMRITALAGGEAKSAIAYGTTPAPDASAETILALGLNGKVRVVPILLNSLGMSKQPAACAQALDLILGAGVRETVFVPEPKAADSNGPDSSPELRPDGKPYGSTITRLAFDPNSWRKWWEEYGRNFDPSIRYRLGRTWSLDAVLATIEQDYMPWTIRQWCVQEFRMHSGYDWDFEIDMPVAQQLTALSAARSWIRANAVQSP